MTKSRKAERLIDRYLGRVGSRLAHLDFTERQEVLDGLRAHIRDELTSRGSNPPSVDDVRAVLASMDDPQSYRVDDDIDTSIRKGRDRAIGRLGFFILLGAIGIFVLGLILESLTNDSWTGVGLIVSGMLVVCALGLGIAGWRSPYGKATIIGATLLLVVGLLVLPIGKVTNRSSSSQPIIHLQGEPTDL
ncbi:hypothetical protein IH601_02775 [Candidatus Bipolaricaulota bacterium]|jgi:hypothetical protein|nr:hypothetical protein [Candidatus Bipolaricaulota bacterium]